MNTSNPPTTNPPQSNLQTERSNLSASSMRSRQSSVGPENETKLRNFYVPTFRIPVEERPKKSSRHHAQAQYRQSLDDINVKKYDTTRVGWKGRMDYAVNAYRQQQLKGIATEHEAQRDPTALLNVAVTTIILLASGIFDIPMEYYLYTELYLVSIRDEFDDMPPNIENLVKHIRYIRQDNNIDWKSEPTEEPPAGLIVSKMPNKNKSRIPLPVRGASRDGVTSTPQAESPQAESPQAESPQAESAQAESTPTQDTGGN